VQGRNPGSGISHTRFFLSLEILRPKRQLQLRRHRLDETNCLSLTGKDFGLPLLRQCTKYITGTAQCQYKLSVVPKTRPEGPIETGRAEGEDMKRIGVVDFVGRQPFAAVCRSIARKSPIL
jgi:hypothetical protein